MAKQTAVVIAPGRGTYNRAELGYLARNHADKADLLAEFDAYRQDKGQVHLTELDGAAQFSTGRHTRGDNASGLIYACGYADFLSIDREAYDIIGVTGNAMGWYTALACAGALDAMGGLEVVNTMGTLMQQHMIGGQLIYPFVDADWEEVPGRRDETLAKVAEIDGRVAHVLGLSIDLGGMLVLAGDEAGLSAFEREMPRVGERFPMRLQNHAGFHTNLQAPVAELGMQALPEALFDQPKLTLIDGRGGMWHPEASDVRALRAYTLGHQVTESFDFTAALRAAARELMPDVFIVLGPGNMMGGAVVQALIRSEWRGWQSKSTFQASEGRVKRLISMGA
jgi:[acyl-carrier-protein] S-malonyltransferase